METSRRTFLRTAALASTAATSAGLPEVRAGFSPDTPVPVIGGPKLGIPVLSRKTGLKITKVESYTWGNLGFVRVQADDGSEGWGQVSNYDADITTMILHRKVAGFGLGIDPADIEDMVDRCIEGNYKYPWSFVCRALTGLETAIWDLLGKREGKSVCELLGGAPRPVPVYGSSMSRTITPEEECQRISRLHDESGFGAFKLRVGKQCGRDEDQWPGRTEALIPAARKAVGADVDLLADGNSCYSPAKAIEVGHLLQEHGYTHFEEPCPYWELEWTAQVAQALKMDVAGGEQDNDLAQWRRMITMRAVDILQPDICYIGGIIRTLRVARMAQNAGLKVVPHSANLSLVTVFTLHVFGAIPNAGKHVEYTIESDEWTKGLYSPQLKVVDGTVPIPGGPGWGITVSPDWLGKASRQVSEL